MIERFQVWKNNRNGFNYLILGLPKWSDSPDEGNLKTFVYCVNTETGVEYTRAVESWKGINRDGDPRFTRIK
jgi:hypothetical protein